MIMLDSILRFFTDPILSAPMWATVLMCLASSIIGVLLVVRRRALLGEAISHTTYLGIALIIYFAADLITASPWIFPILVVVGAFIAAFVGVRLISFMERVHRVSSDSALCFVLSTFLGIGVLLASKMQLSHPIWIQKIQMFLYGQAATITMPHVWVYTILTFLIVFTLIFFFPVISSTFFDQEYSEVAGVRTQLVGLIVRVLLISAIVIGIRSVGVLMMSGMLIAPAAAAKMVARRFSHMFIVAGAFGVVSGFLGNMLSVQLSESLRESIDGFRVTFATGPMILIVAVLLAIIFLLFSRRKGFVWRMLRRKRFLAVCTRENILKAIYKENEAIGFNKLAVHLGISKRSLLKNTISLKMNAMVAYEKKKFSLTMKGDKRAKRIIRLHRLWEVYLFSVLGVNASEVHHSAEEMEHIITKEIEEQLTQKLGDPKKDPHDQEIPLKEEES